MIALAFALQLIAAATDTAAMPGGTPPAPGAPHFAQITSLLMGVPPDSSARAEFDSAFRGVFASDELPGERQSSGSEWKAGLPLPNHFRLLEGDAAQDAWLLEVSIGAPALLRVERPDRHARDRVRRTVVPRLRASRGMLVALTVRVPARSGQPGRTATSSAAFYFPTGVAAGVDLGVPATGYRFPWRDAGRVAGTLVLEALHRESGDLIGMERMDIAPAVRTTTEPGGAQ